MSESLFKLFGVAILGAFLVIFMRRSSSDMATLLKIAVGILLAAVSVVRIAPIIEYVNGLAAMSELGGGVGESVGVLLRVLCVAILTHVCSTVCRDCGEASMAYYTELGGKIEILLLSLPLLDQTLELALDLVGRA